MLNAGHRRGAVAGRCVFHGNALTTEDLPAYCAVAMAGLGWLPDTILSRSIVVRMRRRFAGEPVEPFRHRVHVPQATAICDALASWARTVPAIEQWPELPPEIQDRDADIWEPLIAIADCVGGAWPARARAAAVALVAALQDKEPSLSIRLLADTRSVFQDAELLTSKVLVSRLIKLAESPWGNMKGKRLDERSLARHLRQYGIKSVNIRTDYSIARGYKRTAFHDAWARYLSTPAIAAANDITVTMI